MFSKKLYEQQYYDCENAAYFFGTLYISDLLHFDCFTFSRQMHTVFYFLVIDVSNTLSLFFVGIF